MGMVIVVGHCVPNAGATPTKMKKIPVMREGRPATAEELRCAVEGEPLPPVSVPAPPPAAQPRRRERNRKRKLAIPIYDAVVWLIVTDHIAKERKKWEHLFGPAPAAADYHALCS